MAEDRLTKLYDLSEAMTNAGKEIKEKHENDYKTIIEYLKTSENPKERVLAAQLVARFFKHFPEDEHEAFDSIVDLCESADVDVRKHATMAMIAICRDCKQVVSKAADILIQLYQTNQASEVNLINQSLMTLLNLDIEKFLKSFFANFEDGSEQVRERAIKFLSAKINTVPDSALTVEIEKQLLDYAKKAMEDVTKDEFISFIGILSRLKIAKTNSGQATIVSAIKSQAEMDKEFNLSNLDALDKFLLCTRHTIPFLSQYNRASEYINYICLKILPHLADLTANGNDLKVLQALAEMSPHIIIEDVPKLIDLDECSQSVYKKLLEYLPMPPEIVVDQTTTTSTTQSNNSSQPANNGAVTDDKTKDADVEPATAADAANNDQQEAEKKVESTGGDGEAQTRSSGTISLVPKQPAAPVVESNTNNKSQEIDFQFTHIEYLMYTLVQLCRLKPELYTETMQAESRKQLYHLSNGCKKYTNALEKQLADVKRQDLIKEENKLRSVALRTTKNISAMIVGLFKRPSDFKSSIVLSCKPQRVETTTQAAPTATATTTTSNANRQQQHHKNNSNNNNNNNNNNRQYNNNHYNRGGGNQRQAGQKSKFRGNYQSDYRGGNKKPRHSR